MSNREEDLKEGKRIEDKFKGILLRRNPGSVIEQPDGYCREYDLKLIKPSDEEILFEIKYDRMSSDTGNVAIELSYKGQPSGVFGSNSDYISYYFDGAFRCIETERLRGLLGGMAIIKGGDNNDSGLILIKKQDFISWCTRIDDNSYRA